MTQWSNWAGNQQAAAEVVAARTVAELQALVATGRRIRPIGSGHSFTPIGRPADVQLRLDHLSGIVRADAVTGLVTVYAGTPLHRLNALLEQLGLALENLGDIDRQTIAGALSTGTHGTGARFGGLATQIRGFTMLLADGSILDTEDHPEILELARVGLGALGVLLTVTLQAVPLFALTAREGSADLAETMERFDEHADGTDHFELYWFPHTTRVLTKHNTRTTLDRVAPLSRARRLWEDEVLSNGAFGGVVALGRRASRTVRPLARVTASALSAREYTDVSHRVFVSRRRVRFVEMEYAVPREHGIAVLGELVRTVERSDWSIAFPVEVRVAAADDIPLSTGFERANVYIAIHLPATLAGSPLHTAYFGTFEAIASRYDGRPHWGKMHSLDAPTLRARYPRFDDFVALRDKLDPARIFSNDHLDTILG